MYFLRFSLGIRNLGSWVAAAVTVLRLAAIVANASRVFSFFKHAIRIRLSGISYGDTLSLYGEWFNKPSA